VEKKVALVTAAKAGEAAKLAGLPLEAAEAMSDRTY